MQKTQHNGTDIQHSNNGANALTVKVEDGAKVERPYRTLAGGGIVVCQFLSSHSGAKRYCTVRFDAKWNENS